MIDVTVIFSNLEDGKGMQACVQKSIHAPTHQKLGSISFSFINYNITSKVAAYHFRFLGLPHPVFNKKIATYIEKTDSYPINNVSNSPNPTSGRTSIEKLPSHL